MRWSPKKRQVKYNLPVPISLLPEGHGTLSADKPVGTIVCVRRRVSAAKIFFVLVCLFVYILSRNKKSYTLDAVDVRQLEIPVDDR